MLLLLVDVVTDTVLGIFDHLGASYSNQLNAPGTASAKVALTARAAGGQTWRQNLNLDSAGVAKTFAYLVDDADGTVEWWGMLWGAGVDVTGRTLTLAMAGIESMLAVRTKRTDSTWTSADQATIVHDLLEEAQSGTNRDLRIHNTLTATGVLRDRTVLGAERHPIGQLIAEMGDWINGYDLHFDASWTGGGAAPTHQARLVYPAPSFSPVATLVATGDVLLTAWSFDGTTVATDIDAIGNQIVATSTQAPPLMSYPAIDRAVTHSSVTVPATLTLWANRALAQSRVPQQSGTLRALLSPGDPLPVQLGETFRLIETDLVGIDKFVTATAVSVAQVETGRLVDYTVVDPATLMRTSERI